MALAYLGLGSNLGDRADNIRRAIRALVERYPITLIAESSVRETEPVDFLEQPLFLNQVIEIKTSLPPRQLLAAAKRTEEDLGRTPTLPKGPRVIDIDILLYDDLVMSSESLTIPHPAILRRQFVIQHLVELAPNLIDPVSRRPYRTFLTPGQT